MTFVVRDLQQLQRVQDSIGNLPMNRICCSLLFHFHSLMTSVESENEIFKVSKRRTECLDMIGGDFLYERHLECTSICSGCNGSLNALIIVLTHDSESSPVPE